MTKRLYKSRTSRMISGVCGGVAEYFNIDPTIVRLALVLIAFGSAGTGIIAYIVAAIVMPEAPFDGVPPHMPGTEYNNFHDQGNGPRQ